ncbi:MAG: hypothetical protein HZB26_21140 [Candidatus Hydrogenedentes bacterium]|nr:hypothetical protein [Candidatus Hydrogenedentota bacterium]
MSREQREAMRHSERPLWYSWSIILGVTLSCAALTYAPFILAGNPRTLAGYYDRWAYFMPMTCFLDYCLHHGEFPLWNPLTFCGAPFAANPQVSAFYPPNLLRSLLTPAPTPLNALTGLACLTAAHLIFASVAAFFCARAHRLSLAASLTVAIAYTFGAAMTRRVPDLASFVSMAAWLPLLLLLLQRTLHADYAWRAWRFATLCGLLFGISILVGFPQLTLYVTVIMLCYVVLQSAPSPRLWRRPNERSLLYRRAAALAWIFSLGLLVAAPMLLPTIEYSSLAPRAKGIGEMFDADTYSLSPLYLLRGLVTYPGVTYPGSCGIRMAGTGAFLLAAAALFHPRRRDAVTFIILFLIVLDCSLGEDYPIGHVIAWLAPFKVVVPARASLFDCFMLAMLAGFGVDALRNHLQSRLHHLLRLLWVTVPGLLVMALLWDWANTNPNLTVSRITWAIPAVTLSLIFVCAWFRTGRAVSWVFPVLIFAETLAWNTRYLPYLINIYPFPGDVAALQEEHQLSPANTRPATLDGLDNAWLCENLGMLTLSSSMGGYDPLYIASVRDAACPPGFEGRYTRELISRDIAHKNQRGNLFLKRRFWLARQYADAPWPDKESLFPSATTVFLSNASDLSVPRVDSATLPKRSVSEMATETPIALPDGRIELHASQTSETQSKASAKLPVFQIGRHHSALCLTYTSSCSGTARITFRDTESGQVAFGKDYVLRETSAPVTLEYPLPDLSQVETVFAVTLDKPSGDVSISNMALPPTP